MPLFYCDYSDCSQDRHLCRLHLQDEFHSCPKWEDWDAYQPAARQAQEKELAALFAKINIDALAAHASSLRDGMKCTIPPLRFDWETRSSVMGGMNYHIDIEFEDGVVWLARVRRHNATSPPPAVRDFILNSEAATMMFLQTTKVAAPEIYGFALEGPNNPVGVGYLLIQKLPGKSFASQSPNAQQKEKVISQYADVMIELSRHAFPSFGCLDTPGSLQVGPLAREGQMDLEKGELYTMGPFRDMLRFHERHVGFIMRQIMRKEMYATRRVDAYLLHFFLEGVASIVVPLSEGFGPFYLKHADDLGSHIMVDNDYNITGIIDWEWAHTAPAHLAFKSPLAFLPVGDFFDGNDGVGEDEAVLARLFQEKGHPKMAQAVKDGRMHHFFVFLCGVDMKDTAGFAGLFRGLRKILGIDNEMDWDEWKAAAQERFDMLVDLAKLKREEAS